MYIASERLSLCTSVCVPLCTHAALYCDNVYTYSNTHTHTHTHTRVAGDAVHEGRPGGSKMRLQQDNSHTPQGPGHQVRVSLNPKP